MTEEALAQLLYGGSDSGDPEVAEAAALVRQMVLTRSHRGTGTVRDWFPRTIGTLDLEDLVAAFCRTCDEWREHTLGISLEEAWFRFFESRDVGDPMVREEEFFGAIVRALAVTPRARFLWPEAVRRAPGGCFAVTRRLVLHAALDGRYLRGEITPLVAALLRGESTGNSAEVLAQLRSMRLL
jgi:hypothetical protein